MSFKRRQDTSTSRHVHVKQRFFNEKWTRVASSKGANQVRGSPFVIQDLEYVLSTVRLHAPLPAGKPRSHGSRDSSQHGLLYTRNSQLLHYPSTSFVLRVWQSTFGHSGAIVTEYAAHLRRAALCLDVALRQVMDCFTPNSIDSLEPNMTQTIMGRLCPRAVPNSLSASIWVNPNQQI